MTDCLIGQERAKKKDKAMEFYKKAEKVADDIGSHSNQHGAATQDVVDSVRLGLALNHAIFMNKVQQDKKGSLCLLKRKIGLALEDFEHWPKKNFKEISK